MRRPSTFGHTAGISAEAARQVFCLTMPRRKRRRSDDAGEDSDAARSWDEPALSEQVPDLLVDWAWGKIPA
eukprot:2628462-Pyramimonas_sp.AAC.1